MATLTVPKRETPPPRAVVIAPYQPSDRSALERLSRQVDRGLDRALPKSGEVPQVIHEAMRYCVLSGGKRFRPLLALGGAEAAGGSAGDALNVACAMELIHAYSLVHDDLPAMDNADERRGLPSCHRKYGEANAILVGDALLTLAFLVLSQDGHRQGPAILRTIADASGTEGLIGGQALDLQAISQPRMAEERTLTTIAQRKTAALITASVQAGALAGGASAEQLKKLSRYGHDIGLAFQIIDDIHDMDGLAKVLGLDVARHESRRLIARALDAISGFGVRASTLRRLGTWLATTGESAAARHQHHTGA